MSNDDTMPPGKQIRSLLIGNLGLTPEKIAKILKVHPSTISRLFACQYRLSVWMAGNIASIMRMYNIEINKDGVEQFAPQTPEYWLGLYSDYYDKKGIQEK